MTRGRAALLVLAALLLAGLAALTLGPDPKRLLFDVAEALPGSPEPEVVEAAANVLLLVPVGAVLAALLPRVLATTLVLGLVLASTVVELVQGTVLDGRTSSLRDVGLNAAGAVLGVALVRLRPRRARRARRARRSA